MLVETRIVDYQKIMLIFYYENSNGYFRIAFSSQTIRIQKFYVNLIIRLYFLFLKDFGTKPSQKYVLFTLI